MHRVIKIMMMFIAGVSLSAVAENRIVCDVTGAAAFGGHISQINYTLTRELASNIRGYLGQASYHSSMEHLVGPQVFPFTLTYMGGGLFSTHLKPKFAVRESNIPDLPLHLIYVRIDGEWFQPNTQREGIAIDLGVYRMSFNLASQLEIFSDGAGVGGDLADVLVYDTAPVSCTWNNQ